jgi:pimeloyl-ACP methyl ester carboxylesterase
MNKLTGTKLAFDDIGTGDPALLLLPGWCADRGILSALANRLAKKRRVINIDLPGHNESERLEGDFDSEDVICEVLRLIDSLGIDRSIVVSVAHAGWLAVELRRELGDRIPKMVFLDWIITEPPEIFFETLEKMQQPEQWQSARDALFTGWSLGEPHLAKPFHKFMTNYDFDMWSRAGREISRSYKEYGSALRLLETLNPVPTVLNLYSPMQVKNLFARDDDSSYFEIQQDFAFHHPWFHFCRLSSKSHLPSVEVTEEVADAIESFISNF